ncbi:hypothetical protein BJ875DRAFT_479373 [Amylocarpus encephaloides]|uniref:Ubiquitin-like protease family profile domain-containing protein n=1 Tax=Amylocarpus encephaloides TaxID=45428 RepID=A0A9P7YTH7_9HELO|nr:hypothetical protein BJ875DRAFT_479373 [Amylocarpus encephaloides]
MSEPLIDYSSLSSFNLEFSIGLILDQDIQELADNEFITDSIIRPIMALGHLFQERSGKVTLDTNFISTMNYINKENIISLIRSAPVFSSTDVVIIPFNADMNHWVLAVVARSGKWTIIDSLYASAKAKATLTRVMRVCTRIWFGLQPPPTLLPCPTFQQLDGVSCAIHMTTIATKIMEGTNIADAAASEIDASAIRREWHQTILHYRQLVENGEPLPSPSHPNAEVSPERNSPQASIDDIFDSEPRILDLNSSRLKFRRERDVSKSKARGSSNRGPVAKNKNCKDSSGVVLLRKRDANKSRTKVVGANVSGNVPPLNYFESSSANGVGGWYDFAVLIVLLVIVGKDIGLF